MREIDGFVAITRQPGKLRSVRGVVGRCGRVIPVTEARARFVVSAVHRDRGSGLSRRRQEAAVCRLGCGQYAHLGSS